MIELISNFFDKGLWQSAFVTVATILITYFSVWYKRNNSFHLYLWRVLRSFIFKKKYIVIWNDHHIEVSEKIISLLKEEFPNYYYRCLTEPDELLNYPLSPKYVHMILIIVSDVTKLSESEGKRNLLQTKLLQYARKGGTLFGTHDIIYRRLRNKALQVAFGCEICNFQRVTTPITVEVVKTEIEHPLVRNLETSFEVDDGELCWGEWSKDAKILIRTKGRYRNNHNNGTVLVPFLVIRHTGNFGTLIWMNSADKNEKLSRSLNEPQVEVIQIIKNAVKYSDEIKNTYYKQKNSH